ncbi:MAG: GNAT family N-acetyltransferase [Anaerolineales bacterium]|nr:GNAT family N-acetyltransferase [Anaerolineales bacterium]
MIFQSIKNLLTSQNYVPLDEAIHTEHLVLLPLTREQLSLSLRNRHALETELAIPLSRQVITDEVRCAIKTKLKKMRRAAPEDQLWLTYWLVVVKENTFGAGLAGFKGLPDAQGTVEIGCGIDLACQGQGYMTEAVQALVDWAFQDPLCRQVTAAAVVNPASNRLLEKLGGRIVDQGEYGTLWTIDRPAEQRRAAA